MNCYEHHKRNPISINTFLGRVKIANLSNLIYLGPEDIVIPKIFFERNVQTNRTTDPLCLVQPENNLHTNFQVSRSNRSGNTVLIRTQIYRQTNQRPEIGL